MPLVFKYPGGNKSQGSEELDVHIIRSVIGSNAGLSKAEEQDIKYIFNQAGSRQVHLNCMGRRRKYD
jgi:hypothetical protein